ncbi:hypothetical protein [Nocardia nova]|uniref:hypothetical protein n=1 Tax=Nocardia nova TaxID=37330 RepID=UPI001892ECD0|nr:hypothetical protein [Nocardia nova]MBF6149567.1 hypothetical protein [Nocardia nova]
MRDLLVDYLDEIRPGLDYSTYIHITHHPVRLFWWTVLQINPGQQDLRLSPAVVTAWREQLAVTIRGKAREDFHGVLFTVRAFYRDIGQWALEEPARWAHWAAPHRCATATSVPSPRPAAGSRAACRNEPGC